MQTCFLPALTTEPTIEIIAVGRDGLDALKSGLAPFEAAWAEAAGFCAGSGEVCVLPDEAGGVGRVLFGAGDGTEVEGLGAGRLPGALPVGIYRLGAGFGDRERAAIAWALGSYRFTRYREDNREPRRLVLPEEVDADRVNAIVGGMYLARDLINTPANHLGPAELAEAAATLAGRHEAVFREIAGEALLAEGFPLVHAVGAAAAPNRAPRLIELTWGDRAAPRVTLVGKGVCFDTGGLDIKPANGMALMKKDMGGAASVLGLAAMIMATGLPVRLTVLIPAVENAIAGNAFRPGDVFAARNGLTVEIGNTDAEGRLVLADALAYACETPPEVLIDLATLTGAARVALGPDLVPFYTADDALAEAVQAAGGEVADPMWRMPLWQGYMSMLDSKVADINNAGSTPFAGSVTAALFLSRFVTPETSWLHGDIYGWCPSARPGRPEGGDAQSIRALFRVLEDRYRT